jgi:hypothetical protein
MAAVQNEETESLGVVSDARESGIPMLQPASFATDWNER